VAALAAAHAVDSAVVAVGSTVVAVAATAVVDTGKAANLDNKSPSASAGGLFVVVEPILHSCRATVRQRCQPVGDALGSARMRLSPGSGGHRAEPIGRGQQFGECIE
jgi:hypothetical protein